MSTARVLSGAVGVLGLVGAPWAHARAFYDFQTPVTPIARDVLFIHDLFLVIILVLFLIGTGTLLYSVYAHRQRRNSAPARFCGLVGRKQWLWASVPFAALLVLDYGVLGVPALRSIEALANTSDAAMTIKVTGHQWNWQYAYPAYGIDFTSTLSTPQNEIDDQAPKDKHFLLEVDHPLVLPTHEKVRIILASADVIHAFWVPAFGIKQDAVPGYLRETWVEIDKTGTYRGQCAELCGVGHAFMPIVVKAVDRPAFNQWVASEQAAQAAQQAASGMSYTRQQLIAAGRKVFDERCSACHQPSGLGIAGAFPPIAGGHPFAAPAPMLAALRARGFYKGGDIVVGPLANHIRIVLEGIPGTPMPAFASQLSAADIAAVITYERNDFGNHTGETVEPKQVTAIETGH
jgi:cytochrome c oxidase subunit 2